MRCVKLVQAEREERSVVEVVPAAAAAAAVGWGLSGSVHCITGDMGYFEYLEILY